MLTTTEEWIAILTIISTASLAFKNVRELLREAWRKTFGRRGAQLDRIEAEFKTNGGSTIKDDIRAVRHQLTEVKERQFDFEAHLNAKLNIGTEAIFRTDANGHVITNNRKHQHLTGFSASQVAGEGWINVIHPDWRKIALDTWHDAVSTGREFSEDLLYLKPTGESYMVHVNAYRERDSMGNIRGYLGVVTPLEDMTRCPYIEVCKKHDLPTE